MTRSFAIDRIPVLNAGQSRPGAYPRIVATVKKGNWNQEMNFLSGQAENNVRTSLYFTRW